MLSDLSRTPLDDWSALDAEPYLVSLRIKRRSCVSEYSKRCAPACWPVRCQLCYDASVRLRCQPITKAEVRPSVWSHHDDLGGLNEEHSQISTAAFGDAPQDRSAASAVLSWHQDRPRLQSRDHGQRPLLCRWRRPLPSRSSGQCRGSVIDVEQFSSVSADLLDLFRDCLSIRRPATASRRKGRSG